MQNDKSKFKVLTILALIAIIGCVLKKNDIADFLPNVKMLFKHQDHIKIIDEDKVECIYCHPQHTGNGIKKGLCHLCHKNRNGVVRAPQNCTICHENLDSIKPKDHTPKWRENHAKIAKIDNESCKSCHKDNFCTSCHTKRDDVKKVYHTRNYIFYHSVEARANPHKCGVCHGSDFCTDCHSTRGVLK